MAILNHVEVQVLVDGQPVDEYDDDDDGGGGGGDNGATLTKYIEVVSGKTFEFKTRIHAGADWAGADAFNIVPSLDGKSYRGKLLTRTSKPLSDSSSSSSSNSNTAAVPVAEGTLDGYWHSSHGGYGTSMRLFKYRFADLETRDANPEDDPSRMRKLYGNLGVLKVKVWRTNITGTIHIADSSASAPILHALRGGVPEKALKGKPLDLSTALDLDSAARPRFDHLTRISNVGPRPAAIFVFKYRTRRALQSLMIIPRSPRPGLKQQADDKARSPSPGLKQQADDDKGPASPSVKEERKPGTNAPRRVKRERENSPSFRMRGSERSSRRQKTSRVDGKVVYHLDDSDDDDDVIHCKAEKAVERKRPAKTEVVDLT